jgi:hypothetical protein
MSIGTSNLRQNVLKLHLPAWGPNRPIGKPHFWLSNQRFGNDYQRSGAAAVAGGGIGWVCEQMSLAEDGRVPDRSPTTTVC